MASTTIISDIFRKLDTIGETFISNAYAGLALQVNVVFTSMLVIYVTWWGYMILAGREGFSVTDAAWKLGRAFFIYYMATNWGAFSKSIYVLVQAVPDLISDTIIKAIAGANGGLDGGTNENTTGIVRILDAVFETAVKIYEQVATGTFEIVGAIIGGIVFVIAMIFIAVASAAVLAAKLMLFITLALAPVFIILALYRWTFAFTDGWLRLMVNLMVQQILIYAYLAFFYQLISLAIASADSEVTDSKFAYVAPFVLVCLIGMYVFYLIPTLAAAIVGGGAVGSGTGGVRGMGSSIANTARTGRVAWRGAVSTGRVVGKVAGKGAAAARSARAAAIQRETRKNGVL